MTEEQFTVEPARSVLGNLYGREDAIRGGRCVSLPAGCGKPIGSLRPGVGPDKRFRNQDCLKEYRITGMCQACQDGFQDRLDRADREGAVFTDIFQMRTHDTGAYG